MTYTDTLFWFVSIPSAVVGGLAAYLIFQGILYYVHKGWGKKTLQVALAMIVILLLVAFSPIVFMVLGVISLNEQKKLEKTDA